MLSIFTRTIRLATPSLTEQEKRGALAVPESTPLWAAIMAVIDDHVSDNTNLARAVQTAQNPHVLAHTAGSLDALLSLKEDLAARRADAESNPEGV